MMLASGTSSVMTRLIGRTTSELGAIPMVHIMLAPMHTCIGIHDPPRLNWLHGILAKLKSNATAAPRRPQTRSRVQFPSFGTILGNPTVNPAKDLSNLVVSSRILDY